MITDDELANLPVDPERAFVEVERILRKRVSEYEIEARDNNDDPSPIYLEYMTKTLAASKIFQIEALSELRVPHASADGIFQAFRQFASEVDFVTMQIRITTASRNREGSVALDRHMRTKIHHYIQQIRDLIHAADLETDKKEALLNKLNKFSSEVDRARTNLQSAGSMFIAICSAIGDGAEKLKPVRDLLDSIGRVLGNAKEIEDQFAPRLPPPENRKRIPPPPRVPESQDASLDDDIPF